jgi:hypothetical protein
MYSSKQNKILLYSIIYIYYYTASILLSFASFYLEIVTILIKQLHTTLVRYILLESVTKKKHHGRLENRKRHHQTSYYPSAN